MFISFLLIFLAPFILLIGPVIFAFYMLFDSIPFMGWYRKKNCLTKFFTLLILLPILLVIGLAGGVLTLTILLIPGILF